MGAEVVALLEDDPREPWLLNHAGVALYELGAIRAAEALFTAARRLDAELPDVERNLAECARRRRAGTASPQGLPPAVLAVLRDLAPRAKRVAAAAHPATGMTLSLCMIVKDEEAMIGRCLASVREAVDEIVVVDTGSGDRTVEIAEEHGARVLHHAWTGDFSAARNVSFDAATSDWILYLDADELLVDGDAEALRALTGQTWREAFFLVETNHTGELESGTATTHDALRVFRNRPGYRFSGRIHEQIIDTLPNGLPDRDRAHGRAPGALRLPRRSARRQGQVAAQHRAARAADRGGRGLAVPALQPRLGAHGGRRPCRRAGASARGVGRADPRRRGPPWPASPPRWRRG